MRESQAAVRSGMQADPNVTPFLDVLLVLLIIFMYLSLSQQKVIRALLPDPTPAPGTYGAPIVLEVRPGAMYAINSRVIAGSRLPGELRGIYDRRPEKTLIVRAAPGVRYQEVVSAIDIAKGAGVVAVGLK
jgi:biopolymer transport protein ExbD